VRTASLNDDQEFVEILAHVVHEVASRWCAASVVIVGAGISCLSAAWSCRARLPVRNENTPRSRGHRECESRRRRARDGRRSLDVASTSGPTGFLARRPESSQTSFENSASTTQRRGDRRERGVIYLARCASRVATGLVARRTDERRSFRHFKGICAGAAGDFVAISGVAKRLVRGEDAEYR